MISSAALLINQQRRKWAGQRIANETTSWEPSSGRWSTKGREEWTRLMTTKQIPSARRIACISIPLADLLESLFVYPQII
jgi:hypothetical protein